jgi:hypothetical protein
MKCSVEMPISIFVLSDQVSQLARFFASLQIIARLAF